MYLVVKLVILFLIVDLFYTTSDLSYIIYMIYNFISDAQKSSNNAAKKINFIFKKYFI